jgi:hypothetical protein
LFLSAEGALYLALEQECVHQCEDVLPVLGLQFLYSLQAFDGFLKELLTLSGQGALKVPRARPDCGRAKS